MEKNPDAAPPAPVLAQVFGPPCSGEPNRPAVDLIDPIRSWYLRYVTARCHGAAGRLNDAATAFGDALKSGMADNPDAPLIPVPWLWHWQLLQTHFLAGEHEAALHELEALLISSDSELLRERLRSLILEWVLGVGGRAPALPQQRQSDYLTVYLEHGTPSAKDYDLVLRLWELGVEGKNGGQQAALELLLWKIPKDERAARQWSTLPGTPGPESAVPVTSADYYARAEQLYVIGQFEQLADELESPSLPEQDPVYAKGLGRLYFRALIRANRLSHAAVQVNTGSVMRRFSFDRRQQLIWAIRIQLRRRVIGPVLKYLEELEQLSPKDEELPAIFLELLKYNIGRRDQVTTLHWLERIAIEYPRTEEAAEAYWSVSWDSIRRGETEEAVRLLDLAISRSDGFHPVDQARLRYWRGRVQMRLGDQAGGDAIWKEMEERWPYNYYSALASWMRSGEALQVRDTDITREPERLNPPRIDALWKVPLFPEALFLLAVDERDLVTEHLRSAVTRPFTPEALEEAGALFHSLGLHYLQLRLMANHQLASLRSQRVDDSPLWLRAFPRPHWDVVQREAEARRVDPHLIFAIMREESRFFTTANSTAGAQGLMQLMPSTARAVAKRDGLNYDEALLHTPEFNIPIGTSYLHRVLERFDSNPFYAAAAYNAGPGNVRRWLKRFGRLPLDEFVERVPFGETQRYIKRVFLSYTVYSQLYR